MSMSHTCAVVGSRVYEIDVIAIAATDDENMAGYANNYGKAFVGDTDQRIQSTWGLGIGFKAKIVSNSGYARLSCDQAIIGIPDAHIKFYL